jgi:hypothetical protein
MIGKRMKPLDSRIDPKLNSIGGEKKKINKKIEV